MLATAEAETNSRPCEKYNTLDYDVSFSRTVDLAQGRPEGRETGRTLARLHQAIIGHRCSLSP